MRNNRLTPTRMSLAAHASRTPACGADEWMHGAVEQVRQSIPDATNRVDCLVIETGQPDRARLTRMMLELLYHYSKRQSDATAWLRFAGSGYRNDVRPSWPPEVISTIRDIECAWPSICAALMASLLTVRVAILFEVEHALQRDPARFGKFIAWCAGNLALVVIVVPDADRIRRLDLGQVRIAVDRVVLPDSASVDTGMALTAALLERASKGTQP